MPETNPENQLTQAERERLRPTIDVVALERLLAAAPKESRRLFYLVCVRSVTDDELRSIGITPAPLPKAAPAAPPQRIVLPDGREGRRLSIQPTRQAHLQIRHLEDPNLDRLWQLVEPVSEGGANMRLKLSALLPKEALCCLVFETSAAA